MDTEKISFWVKLILSIVAALLGPTGQIQLARTLMERHDVL